MNKIFLYTLTAFVLTSCGIQLRDLTTTEGESVSYVKGLPGLKTTLLYSEDLNADFWGAETTKCKKLKVSSEAAYKGSKSLYIQWEDENCKFNGFGVEWDGASGKNLEGLKSGASLRIYLKGIGEQTELPEMNISFEDFKGNSSSVEVTDSHYSGSELSTEDWTTLTVPLSELEGDAQLFSTRQLVVTLGGKGEMYMDEIQFVANN